jgi:WD40 repeat protein
MFKSLFVYIVFLQFIDENLMASESSDNSIGIRDLTTKILYKPLFGHTSRVTCLTKLDENSFASGSSDCTVRIWNYMTGSLLHILTGHSRPIISLVYLPIYNILVGGTISSTVRNDALKMWNVSSGSLINTFSEGRGSNALISLGKEKKLFVAGTDGQGSSVERIKIYDALAQSLNFNSSEHTREVSVLAQLDEDNLFVSGSWDKYLIIWNYY